MADIKIYGKLVNKSSDGILADASQIQDGDLSVSEKLSNLSNTKVNTVDMNRYLAPYQTTDALTGRLVTKYLSEAAAKNNLSKHEYGDIIAIKSESQLYNTDYDTYTVVENAAGVKDLKMLTTSNVDTGSLSITIEEIVTTLDGKEVSYTGIENNDIIECDLNAKVNFKYTFISSNYPDSRGTVYFKNGSAILTSQSIYPRDSVVYTWVYDTASLSEPGTYTIQIYGVEATGKTTERKTIKLRVGSLSLSSKFNADDVLEVGKKIVFGPLSITSADPDAILTAHLSFDSEEILTQVVTPSTTSLIIPAENAIEGTHNISMYISSVSGETNKISNTISYNVIVAREAELYVSLDKDTYEYTDGSKIRFGLRVIMLGGEESRYTALLNIENDTTHELVKENLSYNVSFGTNYIDITNVNFDENSYETSSDGRYTSYTATFSVSLNDELNPLTKTITANIKITESEYNITMLAKDALLCEFVAEGKTNSSNDRAIWEDTSGHNIATKFNNFNWTTNGWLEDENSNTALTLNSGAYVEIDLAPFAREIENNGGITISIDFSTRDILDSNAKVVSCLYEGDGTDTITYYLRDAYGNYILDNEVEPNDLPTQDENENIILENVDSEGNPLNANNLVRYFKYAGGYCWADGKTYEANGLMNGNGDLPYLASENVADRIINYNMGIPNESYNNPQDEETYDSSKITDYKKCIGYTLESVTKQTGFYIDTKYAVLSNSASPANIDDKFHLYFSEDTRTKIDLIVTRSNDAPYYFNSMIGYTNGCISLMQQITNNNKFQTGANDTAGNYKIYLGAKALYNSSDRFTGVTDTGECKIYSFRIYNRALTPDEVLVNYASEIPESARYIPTTGGTPVSTKESVIKNNGINKNGTFDNSIIPDVMQAILYSKEFNSEPSLNHFIMQLSNSTGIADLKKIKEPAYVEIIDENGDFWKYSQTKADGTVVSGQKIPVRLQFQGTSSLVYPMKNYKWKCYSADYDPVSKKYGMIDDDGKMLTKSQKQKYDLGAGFEEQTFCFKADYMDSSHCNNTGSANFIADYNEVTGPTPPQKINPSCRTTVYGKPCLLFYVDENNVQHSLGVGNLNLDKSDNESFGLDNKIKDTAGVEFEFAQKPYIDDEFNSDILVKSEIVDTEELTDGDPMTICINNKQETGTLQLRDGTVVGVKASNGKVYEVRAPINTSYSKDDPSQYYLALKNPKTGVVNALLTEKGYLRSLDNVKMVVTQCSEFKANSGAGGAGGFGNYGLPSIAADTELRYVDDGDLEDEEYAEYVNTVGNANAISYTEYRNPRYYCMQRMIKWVSTASREEFVNNLDKHFNRNYLMDYYLTIMLLGGVDSLGKNLMMATWGPENYLYEISAEEAANDQLSFEYTNNGTTRYFTPTVQKTTLNGEEEYLYALDENGMNLYYNENDFSRVTQTWAGSRRVVTTVPGDYIWYPMFYDIDTICGLDNSGQLLFDVDIELPDKLEDGTSVFNTYDSNLWSRVNNYLGGLDSMLAERWDTLRRNKGTGELAKFSVENLVKHFYYENQIAKIPERYYNRDAIIKYVWEGPFAPGETIGGSSNIATVGSGTYLYCIHGSRYEQIKHWYSQRLNYLDTMFAPGANTAASLRFNHSKYDANFNDTDTYYANLATLAVNNPLLYEYDSTTDKLYVAGTNKISEIVPINFNFKTYQPGYVGIKWFNGGDIHMIRVQRDKTATIKGNVKTSGDAEVFIYGGSNIKEIGDMYRYNVKQVDFKNLNKLNKLVLGANGYSCSINKLDLGTNSFLSNLQLVNCIGLTSVDVSNCINLKNVNMTGSKVANITLPASGGALETISYSNEITSITLNNFTNLSVINAPSLDNLTELVITNCPKVLGSPSSETTLVWSLLQRTNKASRLNTIKLTSYGTAEPLITNDTEFFFADKYYEKATAKNIKGLVRYTGNVVPTYYTKFEKAYPELTITYSNITDASEMFANYKNINLIGKLLVVTGQDIYGKDITKEVYYWKDESEYLQNKWHNMSSPIYKGFGYTSSSIYTSDAQFYIIDNISYRLLGIYDNEDLDMLRAEIKKNISNFRKFTNVSGMFRNMTILDYIDPDTFNNIDLSGAETTEMFSGCTNLRYFILPDDVIKNTLVTDYYDEDNVLVKPEDMDENKTYTEDTYYWNPLTETREDAATSVYPKGMRKLGEKMFFGCKKVRVFIKKVSNNDKITIDPTAFEYPFYDDSKTTQAQDVTVERPVICFEHKKEDILTLTTEPTQTYLKAGDEVVYQNEQVDNEHYLYTDYLGQHTLNYSNDYIIFSNGNWLRECYFGVSKFVLGDDTVTIDGVEYPTYSGELTPDGNYRLFYADSSDGKILFDARAAAAATAFNKVSTDSDLYYSNIYNIKSIAIGGFRNLVGTNTTDYQFPLGKYDSFDTTNIKYNSEYSIAVYFIEDVFFTPENVSGYIPSGINEIDIIDTEEIPEYTFTNIVNAKTIGLSNDVKVIRREAFKGFASLERVNFGTYLDIDSSDAGQSFTTLTEIDESAFEGCSSLKKFNIPDTVTTLGINTFKSCSALTAIGYSTSLTTIPEGTFNGCVLLATFDDFSPNITEIGADAFFGCTSMELFDINRNIIFNKTASKKSFNYFTNLARIGDRAFRNVKAYVSSFYYTKFAADFIDTTNPNNSQYITQYCNYAKLIFPATMTYIGTDAFRVDSTLRPTKPYERTEFIWMSDSYQSLSIGDGAFGGLIPAWPVIINNPDDYFDSAQNEEKLLDDVAYLPDVGGGSIGSNVFIAAAQSSQFTLAITKSSERIGDEWVNYVKKFIFNYIGIFDTTFGSGADSHARYVLSRSYTANYAYLQTAYTPSRAITIPSTVTYDNTEYTVKEILTGALDTCNVAVLTFEENSHLELIETKVLTTSNAYNLTAIQTGTVPNIIPDGLTIETGNYLTKYVELISSGTSETKFITLGRYIVGYLLNESDEHSIIEDGELFFSSVPQCDTIFDGAFRNKKDFSKVNLDGIKYIYENAFANSGLDYSTSEFRLSDGIEEISSGAFMDVPIMHLIYPTTIKYVANGAFSSSAGAGKLNIVEFSEGTENLAEESIPFNVQTEIKTGVGSPSTANITLNTIYLPHGTEFILDASFAQFNQLSQIKNLYIGYLLRNSNNGYLVDNNPLYFEEDEHGNATTTTTKTVTNHRATNSNGDYIYSYKFYDMIVEGTYYANSYIETTEPTAVCPVADYTDNENILHVGFTPIGTFDLSYIRVYPNAEFQTGMGGVDLPSSGMSDVQLLMALAGLTLTSSCTVRLTQSQYALIQNYITPLLMRGNFGLDVIRD